MITAIIVLSVLLAGCAAFIFWLLRMLKNTFLITETLVEMVDQKPNGKTGRKGDAAYNGIYYPCHLIIQTEYEADYEGTITDFSRYEENKVVYFRVMTKDTPERYWKRYNEMSEEERAEILEPGFIPNAQVYEIREGVWIWKS